MGHVLNYPWAMGFLVTLVLAVVLDLGFRVGSYYKIQQDPNRKEQIKSSVCFR